MPGAETILRSLIHEGWIYLPSAGEAGVAAVKAALAAEVLMTTDVVVRDGRRLITSARALDLHTDHHRADAIVWQCLEPSTRGGVTRLADAERAYESLAEGTRATLDEVALMEHAIFPDDDASHPMVERVDGRPRFYYSFWFAKRLATHERAALARFHVAAEEATVATLWLSPGDVLAVDNRRILHGRTAIEGSRDRHLVRRWLATDRLWPRTSGGGGS